MATYDNYFYIKTSPTSGSFVDIMSSVYNYKLTQEVGSEVTTLEFNVVYNISISINNMILVCRDGNGNTGADSSYNIFAGVVRNIKINGAVKTVVAYDMLVWAQEKEYHPSSQPGNVTTKSLFTTLCTAADLSDVIDATASTGTVDWNFSHSNIFEKMQKLTQFTTSTAGGLGWQFYHDPTLYNGGSYNKIRFKPRATTSPINYYYGSSSGDTNIKDPSWSMDSDSIINQVNIVGRSEVGVLSEPKTNPNHPSAPPQDTDYYQNVTSGNVYFPTSGYLQTFPSNLEEVGNGVFYWDGTATPETKLVIYADYYIQTIGSQYRIILDSEGYDRFIRIAYYTTSSPDVTASDSDSINDYGTRTQTIYRTDVGDTSILQSMANSLIAAITSSGFKDPTWIVTFKTPPNTATLLGAQSNVYDGLHAITQTGLTIYSIVYNYPEGMNTVSCSNRPIKNLNAQLANEDRIKRTEEMVTTIATSSASYATNPMGKDLDMGGYGISNGTFELLASDPSPIIEGHLYYNTTEHTPYVYNGSIWTSFGGAGGGNIIVGSGCTPSVTQPTVECSPAGAPCEVKITIGKGGKLRIVESV